jgi:Concanavalin A-like lectin/glucanases superfamily/Domain of unknown function (DUF2341)
MEVVRLVLLVSVLMSACSFGPTPAGQNEPTIDGSGLDGSIPDQGFRRRLTIIDAPATELVDFPLLVVLDASRIEYASTLPGGADLRFVDDTGNVLAYEIEEWDPAGRSFVWVKMPRIPTTGETGVWMYYGDPSAVDGQRPAEVWSAGYVAVWHLGEAVTDESTAGQHADSTGHGNVGLQRNNHGVHAAGGIAGVQDFDGSGDYVEVAPTGLAITGTTMTIEARALARSEPTTWPHVVGGGSDGRYWQVFWDPAGQGWCDRYQVSGAKVENWTTAGTLGAWASLASVYDGTAARMYVDGQLALSAPSTGTLDELVTPLAIGADLNLVPRDFDGLIDEVRISNVARSAAWVRAQHLAATDALIAFGAAVAP